MGLDIPRKELKKLEEEYKKNFYANVLYKCKVPKKRRNTKCVGCREAFIYKTKKLIKKGMYTDVISNLEILYYEEGLGYRLKDYYNVKIEKDMINISFLRNQKLLLDEFFGKYVGTNSKMYSSNLITIPSAVLAGIITEGLKNEMFNQNNTKIISIALSIMVIIFIYIVLFYIIFSIAKKMFKSLDKEIFYGFCLEAVNNLLNDVDKNEKKYPVEKVKGNSSKYTQL